MSRPYTNVRSPHKSFHHISHHANTNHRFSVSRCRARFADPDDDEGVRRNHHERRRDLLDHETVPWITEGLLDELPIGSRPASRSDAAAESRKRSTTDGTATRRRLTRIHGVLLGPRRPEATEEPVDHFDSAVVAPQSSPELDPGMATRSPRCPLIRGQGRQRAAPRRILVVDPQGHLGNEGREPRVRATAIM